MCGRVCIALFTGLFALTAAVTSAAAQSDDYPSHAVRLLAPSAPGGNPDVIGRLLANRLQDIFGEAFVVENVPGAGGVVAAKRVQAAPPDGYLLMINDSGALAISVAMNPEANYAPLKDFTPITALATVPTVLVINPSVPAKTLDEFIALAKSKPEALSFGSAGTGSIHHLTMEIFADRAGIDLLHVPYRGGTAMVNGLLTGEIQAGWSGIPNVQALIASGKLRALCLSVLKRSPSVPEVPTCAELGFDGFDVADMLGLHASAGTSPYIVKRLQSAVGKVLREPEIAERMATLGIVLEENGTADYVRFMKYDLERYEAVVKKLHLEIK
jgi:tripartite-type tricarboxylate transporter receptor subunit TctC